MNAKLSTQAEKNLPSLCVITSQIDRRDKTQNILIPMPLKVWTQAA